MSEEAVSEETAVVVPADEADNYVILYSGREESLVQPLIDMFSEQSGIEVDIRYAGTSELAAQLLEEGAQSPGAVFLSQDAGALGALSEAGLFATLPETLRNESRVPSPPRMTPGSVLPGELECWCMTARA